jgi:hypothetical protein
VGGLHEHDPHYRRCGADASHAADPAPLTAWLRAAALLDWSKQPHYYMFARKIGDWSKAADVVKDLPA